MKTLEEYRLSTKIKKYIYQCEYCKENLMVDETDFQKNRMNGEEFFKCCRCGHMNFLKDRKEFHIYSD